jgi:hypothetical protein
MNTRQPTKAELVRALRAAADEIMEMGCTCAEMPGGIHQDGCQGVASAKHYYEVADRALGRTRASGCAPVANVGRRRS